MTLQLPLTQKPSMDILPVECGDQILFAQMGTGSKREAMTEIARIAIVDDDRWMRNSLERLLKSVGFRTESFASAEDYLDAGDHGGIGCIILDVILPGISGFDLYRALAAQHNRVPVVFVSARDEQEARQEAARAGAIGFLGKPFDDISLFYAVHEALRSARRRT